jgi:hypothetical protein
MGPGSARIVDGADGSHRDGAFAVPAAGSRGRAGMFVLAAAAGLALASGAVTGMPAAHAAAAVSVRAAAAMHAYPRFEPCPCDNPICRPVCFQGMAAGGPASMIHRQTHLTAAQAVVAVTATSVNCPPPSLPAIASSDGQPSC